MSTPRAAVLRALIAADDAVTVAALATQLGQHPNTVREHLDALVSAGRAERTRRQPVGRGRPAWLYHAVGPVSAADASEAVDPGSQEYAALAVALIDQVVSSSPDPRAMARHAGERWGRTLVERRWAGDEATGDEATGHDTAGDEAAGDDTAGAGATAGRAVNSSASGTGTGSGTGTDPAGTVLDLLADLRFEPEPAPRSPTVRLTTCPLLDAARRNPDVVCEVHLGIVRGALERLGGDPSGADLIPFAEPGACLLSLPSAR